jgi:hypothetical protein
MRGCLLVIIWRSEAGDDSVQASSGDVIMLYYLFTVHKQADSVHASPGDVIMLYYLCTVHKQADSVHASPGDVIMLYYLYTIHRQANVPSDENPALVSVVDPDSDS